MKNPSEDVDELRLKILGLGENSVRKTHYPSLRQRMAELEQTENALRESQTLLQEIIDTSTAVIYVKDSAGRYLFVNRQFAELFHPSDEIQGKTDYDLFPPERADAFRAFDQQVLASGNALQREEQVPQDDGLHTYISMKAPLRDQSGQIYAVCGISTDITKRKRAEEELRAAETRFRVFVDHATDAFFVHDDSERAKVLDVNRQACVSLGYTREELIGMTPFDFDPIVDEARMQWILERLDAGEIFAFETSHRRKDGTVFPVEIRVRPFWYGGHRFAISLARDITERKRAEESLRRSEQMYAKLVSSLNGIVWQADAVSFQFSYVSPQAERILGYPLAQWFAPNFWAEHIHPEDAERCVRLYKEATENRRDHDFEYRMIAADGRTVWLRDLVNVQTQPDGSVCLRGVMIDVTARKEAEEEQSKLRQHLEQAQKLESLGRLAGGIAHDFNNLLTVLNGHSQLLLSKLPDGHPLAFHADEIHKAGLAAADLTRQLLAFSRKQTLQPKILSLNTIISDMENMLRRLIGENVALVTTLEPRIGYIKADPAQLQQVIMNLVVNARDAIRDSGVITISTGNTDITGPQSQIYDTHGAGLAPGKYIKLTVSDTGCGINEETRRHIFEPFFTTKEPGKGTGLGLSTVWGIVNQSGGHICLESEPNRGSSFIIYLPVSEGIPAEQPASVSGTLPTGTETLLIVEDRDDVRLLTSEILKSCGYRVLEARLPAEALAIWQLHHNEIRLLITDVIMPEMTGTRLAEHFRSQRPEIKILYMSGHAREAVLDPDSLGHNAAFLEKPFSPGRLAAAVRQLLDISAEGQTVRSRNRGAAA